MTLGRLIGAHNRLDLGGSEGSSKIVLMAQNWIFGVNLGSGGRRLRKGQAAFEARGRREQSALIGRCFMSQAGLG